MKSKINILTKICIKALKEANKTIISLNTEGTNEVHNEYPNDISTKGDMAVHKTLINTFKKNHIHAIIYSEEAGEIKLSNNPIYTIVFDEIDGTDNYYRGKNILPYCTVITIYDSLTPKFKDVLIAGIIEHTTSQIWHAVRSEGIYYNDERANTSNNKLLNK